MSTSDEMDAQSWPLHSDDLLKMLQDVYPMTMPTIKALSTEEGRISYARYVGIQELIDLLERMQARTIEEQEELKDLENTNGN